MASYHPERRILILPSSFVTEIVKKDHFSKCLIDQDVFTFDLVLMPYKCDLKWFLFVLDNTKSYSNLHFYDVSTPDFLPDLVSRVRAYLIFDHRQRQGDKSKRSIRLLKVKKFNKISPFSDLFTCLVARSYIIGKPPSDYFGFDVVLLNDVIISDLESFQQGKVDELYKNIFQE